MATGLEDDWKTKLALPAKDARPRTEDVTATNGQAFDDYLLSRCVAWGGQGRAVWEKKANSLTLSRGSLALSRKPLAYAPPLDSHPLSSSLTQRAADGPL